MDIVLFHNLVISPVSKNYKEMKSHYSLNGSYVYLADHIDLKLN